MSERKAKGAKGAGVFGEFSNEDSTEPIWTDSAEGRGSMELVEQDFFIFELPSTVDQLLLFRRNTGHRSNASLDILGSHSSPATAFGPFERCSTVIAAVTACRRSRTLLWPSQFSEQMRPDSPLMRSSMNAATC